jgi:hypothetical protein
LVGRRERRMAVRTEGGREAKVLMASVKESGGEIQMFPGEENAIYEASAGSMRPIELPERTNCRGL